MATAGLLLLLRSRAQVGACNALRFLCCRHLHLQGLLDPALKPLPSLRCGSETGSLSPLQCRSRPFASSAVGDDELISTLSDEIEHEKENCRVAEEEKKPPPKPFSIKDKVGVEEVYLHRSYGQEDISIACLFQPKEEEQAEDAGEDQEEEVDDEEQPAPSVQMTVKVSKGGDDPYLEIVCHTSGEDPVIESVTFKANVDVADLPYEGPTFSDLDDKVRDGFQKYLISRRIDGNLGSYLLNYMFHKEQREYSRWLQNIKAFIAK
eukprot:c21169_g1_i1 orf=238-1029(+)